MSNEQVIAVQVMMLLSFVLGLAIGYLVSEVRR